MTSLGDIGMAIPNSAQRGRPVLGTTIGVLTAISGRWLWRLWWPLAAWLLALLVARLDLALTLRHDGGPAASSSIAMWTLAVTIPVFLWVLWLRGALFALNVGYRRLPTYAVTATASLSLPWVINAVAATASDLGRAAIPPGSPDVFGPITEGSDVWTSGLVTLLGLSAGWLPILAGYLGRGTRGAFAGLLGTLILTGALVVIAPVTRLWLSPDTVLNPATAVWYVAMLPLGWLVFRPRPGP